MNWIINCYVLRRKVKQETEQVRKFYDVIWNQHDKKSIPSVLTEDFIFRGSLGLEKYGHNGFVEYLDMIHKALGNYECRIIELVTESQRVFARMKFSGIHREEFMSYAATGKQVHWEGAALFHFSEGLVKSLWVLGDLNFLEKQLSNK